MNTTWRAGLIAVVVAALLSGCASSDSSRAATEGPTGPTSPHASSAAAPVQGSNDHILERETQTNLTPGPGEATVTYTGVVLTCQSALDLNVPCSFSQQAAFNKYSDRLTAYVNSGRLGALNDTLTYSYQDVSWIGLMSCVYRARNLGVASLVEESKSPKMLDNYSALTDAEVLQAWNLAFDLICPDLAPS